MKRFPDFQSYLIESTELEKFYLDINGYSLSG